MNGKKVLKATDRIAELEKAVANLQMAVNISQAMIKNMNREGMRVDKDISNLFGIVNNLQYRTLAMMENSVFNKSDLNNIADSFKLKDFNDASDKEDADKGLIPGEITTKDSTVIITSTCGEKESDGGIFRSKLAIKDAVLPELKEKLVGLKVGDHVKATINGKEHDIELLAIREVANKEIPSAVAAE